MKALYRRQKQQYLFAGILGVIAVINLLFFLILYRPARSEYHRLQDSIQKLQVDIESRRQTVERLERMSAQLETSEQDRRRLFTTHFKPRNEGWSQIVPELDEMAKRTGVKKPRVEYSIDEAPQYGLYSVKIRIPVQGGYPNVVNFIKDIENSETFFIIDSIDVRSTAAATPGATEIALALSLETFFYQ